MDSLDLCVYFYDTYKSTVNKVLSLLDLMDI
jgi:hypothetical protein